MHIDNNIKEPDNVYIKNISEDKNMDKDVIDKYTELINKKGTKKEDLADFLEDYVPKYLYKFYSFNRFWKMQFMKGVFFNARLAILMTHMTAS